nr:MAG TPA: hypothetical protein [Caudoviricetes sp.]
MLLFPLFGRRKAPKAAGRGVPLNGFTPSVDSSNKTPIRFVCAQRIVTTRSNPTVDDSLVTIICYTVGVVTVSGFPAERRIK